MEGFTSMRIRENPEESPAQDGHRASFDVANLKEPFEVVLSF